MRRVQSLQNAAARLITGARRRDHITPVLCQLPWLPVLRRVEFILACLVRQALCGQNLADDIHLVSEGNRRSLRYSSDNMCAVPRTHNSFGDRSFGAAGPRVLNSLPCGLRTLDISYKRFKTLLKTYMFDYRPRRFVTFYISALEILLLTYLLTYLLTHACSSRNLYQKLVKERRALCPVQVSCTRNFQTQPTSLTAEFWSRASVQVSGKILL